MKKLLYTTIAILGFANLTMAQVPSYVPTNGLVGYWPFNGNANDASGNGNNGTVNGATLNTDRFGINNSAYNFNVTNSNIVIPNKSTQNFTTEFTISLWAKYDSSIDQSLFIRQGTGNNYDRIWLHVNRGGNPNYFRVYNENSHSAWFSSAMIKYNQWYNIIAVLKDSSITVYNNGILISQTKINNGLKCSQTPMVLGNASGYGNYNGLIDDVAIWNRALSSNEVNVLYTQCKDTFTIQPSNLSGAKGTNKNLSFTHSGTGYNNQWQSNSVALGWQNVPNANQYSGVTSNSLAVNGLTVSNHNQLFRVISSKQGCADTSNIVKLTVSDVTTDSLNVISLKTDTTTKGNTIRQLQTDLANKHDTLYVGSTITTDTLKISIRTGISTASPVINSLKVYPNPASTLLNIVLEKPGYYVAKLSSVTGQSIITPTSGTIDISALSNGVYILTIYDSNNKLISTNKVSIIK
jgi:hypothetical protein